MRVDRQLPVLPQREVDHVSLKLGQKYFYLAKRNDTVRSTSRTTTGGRASAGSGGSDQSSAMIIELNKQISELKMTVDGLEKERDFYFGKLRDIEILVQEELDANEQQQPGHVELPILKEIQAILYSTEVKIILYINGGMDEVGCLLTTVCAGGL